MKRLTKKQAKLARARVKEPDATLSELGQKVGYSDAAHTKRALDTEHVQDRVRRLMDANPALTTAALTKKLAQKLNAKETKVFHNKDTGVVYSNPMEDHGAQLRALEIAGEWRGIAEKRVRIVEDPEPPMSLAQARDIILRAQCLPRPPAIEK